MARKYGRARSRRRHQVLIVDDYDDTREAIVGMLGVKGFDAVGAASGAIALELFRAGMRPCVVFLDVRMPGMTGFELWERMRSDPELARIPVVILSALAEDGARAAAPGIRDFLRKPIDASELQGAVRRHCERHTIQAPDILVP